MKINEVYEINEKYLSTVPAILTDLCQFIRPVLGVAPAPQSRRTPNGFTMNPLDFRRRFLYTEKKDKQVLRTHDRSYYCCLFI